METKSKLSLADVTRKTDRVLQSEEVTVIMAEVLEFRKEGVLIRDEKTLRLTLEDNSTLLVPKAGCANLPKAFGKGVVATVKYEVAEYNGEDRVFVRAVEFPEPKHVYITDEQAKLIFG